MIKMITATLDQRTQKVPDTFADPIPEFEDVHLISNLQTERLTNKELRSQWFHTGDGAVSGLKNDNVMFYWTDFPNNPFTKYPRSAAQALMGNQPFFVNPEDAKNLEEKAASSNGVVAFNLSSPDLHRHLQRLDDEYSYIGVSAAKLAEGRAAFEQEYGRGVTALFDRIHGDAIYGGNGIGSLLFQEGKKTARIYVVSPEHAKKVLKGKENGTMLARASRLFDFADLSYGGLVSRDVVVP